MQDQIDTLPSIDPLDFIEKTAIDICYVPNVPDLHGQYMSEHTVRKACESFNSALEKGLIKSSIHHVLDTDSFEIVKTWINECDCTIGETFVKEGTWLAKTVYKNERAWAMKVSGEFAGISIGARGVIQRKQEGVDG